MIIEKQQRLSRSDLFLSFGVIAFPLHVWAIINILIVIPAWLLRFSTWELVGAISYPLVDILLESLFLWIGLIILGYIFPRRWFADKFVALSGALVWVLAGWAALAQFIFKNVEKWGLKQVLPGFLLVLFSFCIAYWLVQRYGRLEDWIKRLAQGLAILSYLYILFDLIGLVVVILRII